MYAFVSLERHSNYNYYLINLLLSLSLIFSFEIMKALYARYILPNETLLNFVIWYKEKKTKNTKENYIYLHIYVVVSKDNRISDH